MRSHRGLWWVGYIAVVDACADVTSTFTAKRSDLGDNLVVVRSERNSFEVGGGTMTDDYWWNATTELKPSVRECSS
jgi:hypothetical protein